METLILILTTLFGVNYYLNRKGEYSYKNTYKIIKASLIVISIVSGLMITNGVKAAEKEMMSAKNHDQEIKYMVAECKTCNQKNIMSGNEEIVRGHILKNHDVVIREMTLKEIEDQIVSKNQAITKQCAENSDNVEFIE